VAHELGVVPPKSAQLIFIHVMTDGRAIGQLLFAMNAAADEEPLVALGLETDLVALHDLDVVGERKPAGPKLVSWLRRIS